MVARNKVSLRPFLLNIQNLCFDTRNAENSFLRERERERGGGWEYYLMTYSFYFERLINRNKNWLVNIVLTNL